MARAIEQLEAELAVYKSAYAKAYSKQEPELNEIVLDGDEVRPEAVENLLTLDASKTKRLKGDNQLMFDKGYQKGEAEIRNKIEKHTRTTTGYDGEAIDTEDLIVKSFEKTAEKSKKTTLTDEDVKKHPLFLAKEKELQKVISESIPKAEHEKFVSEITRKEKLSKVKSAALKLRNEILFEKAENPAVQSKRDEYFLNDVTDGLDFEENGDNDFVIVKDGKRLEDDHGNPIKFSDFVTGKTSEHFVILKQSPKGSAGNGNPDVKTTPSGTVTIKDEAHYAELMAEIDSRQAAEKDPAKVIEIRKERAKLGETWMNQSKK